MEVLGLQVTRVILGTWKLWLCFLAPHKGSPQLTHRTPTPVPRFILSI